jgi:hypothetical protein
MASRAVLGPHNVRLAGAVHLEAGPGGVASDQLGRGSVAGEGEEDEREGAGTHEHRGLLPSQTQQDDRNVLSAEVKWGLRLGQLWASVRVRRHARLDVKR